jgi:hypothetical protein
MDGVDFVVGAKRMLLLRNALSLSGMLALVLDTFVAVMIGEDDVR